MNQGYGFKSDIWSLGCVLYEMITFGSPFQTNERINLNQLFFKIISADYLKLNEKACSQILRHLVDRMLQAKPENRIELSEVIAICDKYLSENKVTKSKIDVFTISEDMQEKLKIMNFKQNFTDKTGNHINKYTFVEEKKDINQFKIFYELTSWIIYLIKNVSTQSNV